MTVAEALAWGAQQLPAAQRRDVAYLLRAAMRRDAAYLLAHGEQALSNDAELRFRASIERRKTGEPVQYIVGTQEFWGLELSVTPEVLIPRPETEHVVEAVLARTSPDAELRIADVGTGSGALAIALAKELPRATLLATDISAAALQVAQANALRHGVGARISFLCCDLLPAEERGLDVVVSNPPYIGMEARASLPREVRDFEPRQALFAGEDGLAVYRRLAPAAHAALKPGGWLVMELGCGQATAVRGMLAGWHEVAVSEDLQGIARVMCARAGGS